MTSWNLAHPYEVPNSGTGIAEPSGNLPEANKKKHNFIPTADNTMKLQKNECYIKAN